MKISVINSVCVHNDAISKSVYDQIQWLRELGHEVLFFCYKCEYEQIHHCIVQNTVEILQNEHYKQSKVVIFHFGIYYELFNLIRLSSATLSRSIVVFHNITPPELQPKDKLELIYLSLGQLHNLNFADLVICDSRFNLECISELCNSRKIVLDLPVAIPNFSIAQKKSAFDGTIRILYISRFVKSKNPEDLLDAIGSLISRQPSLKIEVTFVGNSIFSDEAILSSVKNKSDQINNVQSNVKVFIRTDITEKEKWSLIEETDIFVLPSEHEGFAVPVLEALSRYCRVITYDNTNLRFIGGNLVNRVETRNVEQLTLSILENIRIIQSISWQTHGFHEYSTKCDSYLRTFDPERIKRKFYTLVFGPLT